MTNSLMKFEKAVESLIYANNFKSILIAVSGGKDSAAMLDMLYRWTFRYTVSLSLFHLNHNTRNGESDRDADFVKTLAEKYNLKLYSFSYTFPSTGNFESQARKKRYELMYSILETHAIDCAATAHTLDDSIETTFMRICNGTSIYGMRGIDALSNRIIRPVLQYTTEEILEYCTEQNLEYMHDSTNSSLYYERNYLRNKVLPPLYDKYNLRKSIPSLQKHAGITYSLAREYILTLCGKTTDNKEIMYKIPGGLSQDKFSFLISIILREDIKIDFTQSIINEILKKNKNSKQNCVLFTTGGTVLYRRKENHGTFLIISQNDPTEETVWGPYTIRADQDFFTENAYFSLSVKILENSNINTEENMVYLTYNPAHSFCIRMRRNGDTIQHNNMHKKIKKVLINNKLTQFEKSISIVICAGQEIAALIFPGNGNNYCVSDNYRVTDKTKKILAIRYTQKYELKNWSNVSSGDVNE